MKNMANLFTAMINKKKNYFFAFNRVAQTPLQDVIFCKIEIPVAKLPVQLGTFLFPSKTVTKYHVT